MSANSLGGGGANHSQACVYKLSDVFGLLYLTLVDCVFQNVADIKKLKQSGICTIKVSFLVKSIFNAKKTNELTNYAHKSALENVVTFNLNLSCVCSSD